MSRRVNLANNGYFHREHIMRPYANDDLTAIASLVMGSQTLLAAEIPAAELPLPEGGGRADRELLLLGAADRASGSAASLESMDISEFSLPSGRMARIRFVPHSVLEELRSLCVRAVDGRSVPSMKVNPPTFAFSQLLLLHRIRTGLALTNESIHSAWRAELRCDALPSVLAARHLRFAGERVEETKALLAAPSLESAQWCARQAANELLAATLCSVGSTDPRPEWHLRQLRASTPDLGEAEVARLIDAVCGWSSSSLERTQSLLKICEDLALAVIDRLPDVADYATGVLGGDPRQPRQ